MRPRRTPARPDRLPRQGFLLQRTREDSKDPVGFRETPRGCGIGTDPGRTENVGGRRRVHEFQHPPSRHPRYIHVYPTCVWHREGSRGNKD